MIPLAAGGVNPAIVTSGVLAFAAIISSGTPIVMARRRHNQDAIAEARRDATYAEAASGKHADLTLASWTALNGALQAEIGRLQGVVDRMQGRIDRAEAEIAALNATIRTMDADA
jgi:peptidoglycan hydrolase CwlO-like protein